MTEPIKNVSKKQIKPSNAQLWTKLLVIVSIAFVLLVTLTGLSYQAITSVNEQKTHQTQENRLAIIELVRKEGTETVFLANDYGFLIQWLDNQEPNLYIYNKPEGSIQMTTDFSVFLEGLKEFPDGAKVDRIRGCGITASGMSEDDKQLLQQLINAKSFYMTGLEENNYTVCSCETFEVRYLTTTDNNTKSNKTDEIIN